MRKFKVEKLGLAFGPNGSNPLAITHAQILACTKLFDGKTLRVFHSSRDKENVTRAFYVDMDLDGGMAVRGSQVGPVLDTGKPGMFDEHGVMPSSILRIGTNLHLFYSGWQRSVGVPYNNYTGLAISQDNGVSFERASETPVLDRGPGEPYSATSPEVIEYNGLYYAYYSSGVNWLNIGGKLEHTYDIKIARSSDLLNWEQTGKIALPLRNENEAVCKLGFFELSGVWYAVYSKRSAKDFRDGEGSYRIYICEVELPYKFKHETESVLIEHSNIEGEWDGTMTAYPTVFHHNGQIYILYNGNGFGRSGFGIARVIAL